MYKYIFMNLELDKYIVGEHLFRSNLSFFQLRLISSCFQAQKYQSLLDDRHQKHLQLSLAELYLNERDIGAISDTLRERQHSAAAKNSEMVNWEQTVKAHKKEHGRLTREQQHIDKEIRCVCVFFFSMSRNKMTLMSH